MMNRIGRIAKRIIKAADNDHEGHYVTLRKTPEGNLEMIPTSQLLVDIAELRERFAEISETEFLYELLEDILTNSDWEFVRPEEIAALTAGDIISDTTIRDEHGDLLSADRVYWDSSYQTDSTVEALLAGRSVVWQGVEGESARPPEATRPLV